MSYRQILDEAIGESPPSTVDIDGIRARQRKRSARRRSASAVLGVVTAVSLIAGGFAIAHARQDSRPAPAEVNGPESRWAVADRLSQIVWADLKIAAPDIVWVPNPAPGYETFPGGEIWLSTWANSDSDNTFLGQGLISSGGRVGTLLINIGPASSRPRCVTSMETTCTIGTGPRGETVETTVAHYGGTHPEQIETSVRVLPGNGLVVLVESRNQSGIAENDAATGDAPPLTGAQLRQIALDPALRFSIAPAELASSTSPKPRGPSGPRSP